MPNPPKSDKELTACPHCAWKYPNELLMPVVGSDPTPPICGICALAHTNKIHGAARTQFQGTVAEEYRLDAIDWRRVHPEHKP